MFNSGILDVAIGLVFIFLLLSLICSAINEMIEAWFKMRAADLEKGIREFLYDKDGTGLAQKLYEHPLVFGLYKGKYTPKKSSNLPSYIPPRNFALALMDIILPADKTTLSGAAGATVPPPAAQSSSPSGAAGAAVLPPAAPPGSPGSGTPPSPLQPLRDAIAANTAGIDKKVKKALFTLVDAAGNDINKARENIESWFNNANERIGGWYKRRTQWIVLALGLAVAIAVNADTITIARSLSLDTAMRNSLVAAAQEYVKANPALGRDKATPEDRLKKYQKEIQKLGLPIGWNLGKEQDERSIPPVKPFAKRAWLLKLLGWLLTAMAISLGAPFWFDLLNKFMNARSTLKPTKPEEPQKGLSCRLDHGALRFLGLEVFAVGSNTVFALVCVKSKIISHLVGAVREPPLPDYLLPFKANLV